MTPKNTFRFILAQALLFAILTAISALPVFANVTFQKDWHGSASGECLPRNPIDRSLIAEYADLTRQYSLPPAWTSAPEQDRRSEHMLITKGTEPLPNG